MIYEYGKQSNYGTAFPDKELDVGKNLGYINLYRRVFSPVDLLHETK